MSIIINGVEEGAGGGAVAEQLENAVYFDSINGVAGTDYPIGMPGSPVSSPANALTIAAARKVNTIKIVHGKFTLPSDIEHLEFWGNGCNIPIWNPGENEVELNGHTATSCSFKETNVIDDVGGGVLAGEGFALDCGKVEATTMFLVGARHVLDLDIPAGGRANDAIQCFIKAGVGATVIGRDCYLLSLGANVFLNDSHIYISTGELALIGGCRIRGATVTLTENKAVWLDCTIGSGDGAEPTLILDCTGIAIGMGNHELFNIAGKIKIKNLTTAAVIDIIGNGLDLDIDATCTSGTINISGSVKVTDNSAGTTVNDNSIETKLFSLA
jgi:hypothetical protein